MQSKGRNISGQFRSKSKGIWYQVIEYVTKLCQFYCNLIFVVKILEKLLPTLLSMHGVNKALEIFLNVDYDLALETFADFQKTHEKILESKRTQYDLFCAVYLSFKQIYVP